MKGYHPTPKPVVELMVSKLFKNRIPHAEDVLLDPGCGRGEFIDGVLSWCDAHGLPPPTIVGVESDPEHSTPARARFRGRREVKIRCRDFLGPDRTHYDFVIGNPPYVPITGLSTEERNRYRRQFSTAVERFDLYLLFFEQGLRVLAPNGRLCFVTPEKFEYTHSATPLRRLMANQYVTELDHLDEGTFPGLVTYPTVTTLENRPRKPGEHPRTLVRFRDGTAREVELPPDGSSWNRVIHPMPHFDPSPFTLEDVCERVSCGIATGADSLYVMPTESIPPTLRRFAYPTLAGRQLGLHGASEFKSTTVMLVPYDHQGKLLPEGKLGDLFTFLSRPDIARRLKQRTCATDKGRAWYRFHDNVPLDDILRPKILTKDITSEPRFWADHEGRIVPRHTVYYIVPKEGVPLIGLLDYLNGPAAVGWLRANCQRAANGFLRVQSAILKELPVPEAIGKCIDPDRGGGGLRDRSAPLNRRRHRQATLAV